MNTELNQTTTRSLCSILDGDIGTITIDIDADKATTSEGHTVTSFANGKLELTSSRYPFCAQGDLNDDRSIRSGMTLVPFAADLNRFILKLNRNATGKYRVQWGEASHEFTAEELQKGISLAVEFSENSWRAACNKVDAAVAVKQAYETEQIKKAFLSPEAKIDFPKVVAETEAIRQPLADAIVAAMQPVNHAILISKVADAQ